jgi:Protein of unknown function (DUF1574)
MTKAQSNKSDADAQASANTSGRVRRIAGFLFYPLALLFAAYFADKLLFIWRSPDYFLRTVSFLSYEQKDYLLYELEQYLQLPERRRTLVVFGNSRSQSLDPVTVESLPDDWTLFNFSVPGGDSAYFAYLLERFKAKQLRPDFIYFVVSPEVFNRTPTVQMDEVMLNGLPPSFVVRHLANFSVDGVSNYAAKRLFWSYQYHFSPSTIRIRLKDEGIHLYRFRLFAADSVVTMHKNRGSTPYNLDLAPPQDPDYLLQTAEGDWNRFMTRYSLDENQLAFANEMLDNARAVGANSALIWVKVGPDLRRFMNERETAVDADGRKTTVRAAFEPVVRALAAEKGAGFLDMNYAPAIECDAYYDSSHLAGICMREFAEYLIRNAR